VPRGNIDEVPHCRVLFAGVFIAVVELSQSSWLVAGVLPGIERQPRKKLEPSPERLLALLQRWQDEAVRADHTAASAFRHSLPASARKIRSVDRETRWR
jgi:hypothetical protein